MKSLGILLGQHSWLVDVDPEEVQLIQFLVISYNQADYLHIIKKGKLFLEYRPQ